MTESNRVVGWRHGYRRTPEGLQKDKYVHYLDYGDDFILTYSYRTSNLSNFIL